MAVECAIVLPIMQVDGEEVHVSHLKLHPVTSDRSPEDFPHPAPPMPYRLVDLASCKMLPNSDDDDDGQHELHLIFLPLFREQCTMIVIIALIILQGMGRVCGIPRGAYCH